MSYFYKVVETFHRVDLRENGTIETDKLIAVISSLDPTGWPVRKLQRMVECMDPDGNGHIDYEKFLKWVWGDAHIQHDDPLNRQSLMSNVDPTALREEQFATINNVTLDGAIAKDSNNMMDNHGAAQVSDHWPRLELVPRGKNRISLLDIRTAGLCMDLTNIMDKPVAWKIYATRKDDVSVTPSNGTLAAGGRGQILVKPKIKISEDFDIGRFRVNAMLVRTIDPLSSEEWHAVPADSMQCQKFEAVAIDQIATCSTLGSVILPT